MVDDQPEPTDDPTLEQRGPAGDAGVSVEAERGAHLPPAEAIAAMRIRVPYRGNRALREVVSRANNDLQLKALDGPNRVLQPV